MRTSDTNFDRIQARQNIAVRNNSQMSRISELGISESRDEKETASVKEQTEKRVRNLGIVKSFISKVELQASGLSVMDERKREKLVSSLLARVQAMHENPKLPKGAGPHLLRIRNELLSLKEGIAANAVKPKDMILATVQPSLEGINTLISKAELRLSGESINDSMTDEAFKKAEEVLKHNQKEAKQLERLTKKPFVVARVPIVPISSPVMNVGILNRSGIKAEQLAGYPLIHNQMVIGISKDATVLETRKRNQKPLEAAREILSQLVGQTQRDYIFVTENGFRSHGGIWFWVATKQEVNAFIKAANNRLKIDRWGFGFGSSN